MDINKLSTGNVIKYNNRYDIVMKQLNYNEYLIDHCGKLITVNILDIQPVELKDNELKNLGFFKRGKNTSLETKKQSIVWSKEIRIGEDEDIKIMAIDMFEDTAELSLDELTGIIRDVPEEYKYVHQIQNLLLYVTNDMPAYEN